MRKILPAALLLLPFALPAHAENGWSFGAGIGPFVFGYFVERTTTITTETGSGTTRSRLSAATRPGASADIERDVNGWLGIRLDAAWTRAPMKVKSGSNGVAFEAGHADITTFAAPLIVNFNRHGAFRVHLTGGPAYALYDMKATGGGGNTLSIFNGTRGRWGGIAGGGVAWWMSDRFAIEGEADDIITASPFRRSDFPATNNFGGVQIPKTHNVHTTAGIRYRW
jgi:hypothetical protein